MKRPKNLDIRNKISEFNLKYWEVAENLGITDSTFSRRLRKELPEEEKTKITEAKAKFDEVLKTKVLADIESAQKELESIFNPIMERIYKENAPKQEGGGNPMDFMNGAFSKENPFNGNSNPFGDFNTTQNA